MHLRTTERTERFLLIKETPLFPAFLRVLQESLRGVDKFVVHKRVHRDKYTNKLIVSYNQKDSLSPLWLIALFGLSEQWFLY
jgi:hypothetical protein